MANLSVSTVVDAVGGAVTGSGVSDLVTSPTAAEAEIGMLVF